MVHTLIRVKKFSELNSDWDWLLSARVGVCIYISYSCYLNIVVGQVMICYILTACIAEASLAIVPIGSANYSVALFWFEHYEGQ